MSGTSTSQFTASATVPNQEAWGHYHRFTFSPTDPHVRVQSFSQFVPTVNNDSTINFESRNFNYAGFRWHHVTKSTDTNKYGSFHFQNFISDGTGTDIFSFDGTNFNIYAPVFTTAGLDMGSQKITNVAPGVAGTDAVNVNQLNAVSAGSITLTGNVTGSGILGTPFSTTISSTLDQIPSPIGSVNINSQNITNVGNLGIGVSSPTIPLQFSNTLSNCKICLYQTAANSFQVYGIGVTGSTLKYTVDSSSSSHVFYCGASSTTSTELFRIAGTGIVTLQNSLNMNSNKITSLANGTVSSDGVNLGQMNSAISSAISAGTITLTGNVTGSGTVGTPFATTIASTLNNIPLATGTVNLNTQNLSNAGNIGAGISGPTYPLQFASATSDCKLCLYSSGANNFQVYGFGVTAGTLKYSVDSLSSAHTFYGASSSTASTEFFKIKNTYATCVGGTGTFYARTPSAHISVTSGSYTTTPNTVFVKLNATTSATSGAVQFSTSNNRITFNGSDLSASETGMVSGSLNVAFNDTSICTFAIYKNGSQITTTYTWGQSFTTNQPFTVVLTPTMVTLSPTDYLEIWASSSSSTTVITVTRLNLSFQAC